METVREQWTDERLDDLKDEVGALRGEMRDEFRAVRSEMQEEFRAVRDEMRNEFRAVRTEMKEEFRAVRDEIGSLRHDMHAGFDSLHRTMIQFGGVLIAALIGLIATQLWIASQL
jgi:predicted  nucleic acid-binding Zn-ribbon protein